MKSPVNDQSTNELFERSERILNKSRMLAEASAIQSRKLAMLVEQSEKLTERRQEATEEKTQSFRIKIKTSGKPDFKK